MSQTQYRLRKLEAVLTPKNEPICVLTVGMWERIYYMFVPKSSLREGESRRFHGPFNGYLEACRWALNDLRARDSGAYLRLEKEGLQQIIDRAVQQKQLMVHLETSPLETAT